MAYLYETVKILTSALHIAKGEVRHHEQWSKWVCVFMCVHLSICEFTYYYVHFLQPSRYWVEPGQVFKPGYSLTGVFHPPS